MSYRMYLDDYRKPPYTNLVLVKSFEEAVAMIERDGMPVFISFDHDLSEEHYEGDFSSNNTGYDFAKWLVEKDLDSGGTFIPKDFTFHVHSMNPVGAENIRARMTQYLSQRVVP